MAIFSASASAASWTPIVLIGWRKRANRLYCGMRTTVLICAVAMLLGPAAGAVEGELKFENLPPAVRKTVEAHLERGTLGRIMVRIVSGRTVYDVEIDRKRAVNRWLRIAEDGTLLWGGADIKAKSGQKSPHL